MFSLFFNNQLSTSSFVLKKYLPEQSSQPNLLPQNKEFGDALNLLLCVLHKNSIGKEDLT
jgi:hypothetical protein